MAQKKGRAKKKRAKRKIKVDFNDPKFKARFERALAREQKKAAPLVEAIRKSRRITAEDLSIMVY